MRMRLAMREEGYFWNAYIAKPDTMEDARLIGSIRMGAVAKDPELKADFMAIMQRTMGNAIEEITGRKPDEWDIQPAPPGERKQ